jgi:hypothetical protein
MALGRPAFRIGAVSLILIAQLGHPDNCSDKLTLIVLSAVAILLYGLLTVFRLAGWLKAELAWLFAYTACATIRIALGACGSLGSAFQQLTLCVAGATIGVAVVQMRRAAQLTGR